MTAVFHITADLLGQQYTFPQDIPDIAISYSIPCNWCPEMYIEQTGRTLRHQLAEHRRAVKNGDVAASVLAEHTLDTGHPLDLNKAEVINHHPHTMTRCLLESWHIQKNQGTLNRVKGTLPEMYKALLE